MRKELEAYLKEKGADVVGIASVDNYVKMFSVDENCENHPSYYIKNPKSIIVIGLKMVDSLWDNLTGEKDVHSANLKSYLLNYNYDLLDYLAIQTCRFIENKGYDGYPIQARAETRKNGVMTGYFSFKNAAVAAGLGSIGKNSLVVSEKYGTRVRFVIVITDMFLQPDVPNYKKVGEVCGNCTLCIDGCPVNAISYKDNQAFVEQGKCQSYMDFCQCAYCQGICPTGKIIANKRRKMINNLGNSDF